MSEVQDRLADSSKVIASNQEVNHPYSGSALHDNDLPCPAPPLTLSVGEGSVIYTVLFLYSTYLRVLHGALSCRSFSFSVLSPLDETE